MRGEYKQLVENILLEATIQSISSDLMSLKMGQLSFVDYIENVIAQDRFVKIMKQGFKGIKANEFGDNELVKQLDHLKKHNVHLDKKPDLLSASDRTTAIQFYIAIIKNVLKNIKKINDLPEELQQRAKLIVALMIIVSDFTSSNGNIDQLLVIPSGDLRAEFDDEKIDMDSYRNQVVSSLKNI